MNGMNAAFETNFLQFRVQNFLSKICIVMAIGNENIVNLVT